MSRTSSSGRARAVELDSYQTTGSRHIGPRYPQRGIADLDGKGDVVGGIVIMRFGENALKVIERVRAKLEELKPSLPPGVEIVTTYDRGISSNGPSKHSKVP